MDRLMPYTPQNVGRVENVLEVFSYLVQMHDDLERMELVRADRLQLARALAATQSATATSAAAATPAVATAPVDPVADPTV